jgi:hypothetical protein
MPEYILTSPDGQKFKVTIPDKHLGLDPELKSGFEDRRSEKMSDFELIGRQLKSLAKDLNDWLPPRKELPEVARPPGQLPIDAGFDDIGSSRKKTTNPSHIRTDWRYPFAGPMDAELSQTSTHQAEQPNPAEPYLKGAKDFARGGVSDVMRGAGVQMPQTSNAVGDLLKSDAANTAIGMVNPIKGNFNPNRFASPAAPSNMNVRAGGVKWHANDPTAGGPSEVWTAFDAHDRTLSDIVAEWNWDNSKNEGRYTYKPRLWVKAGKDSISPVDRDVTFDNVADAQRYSEEMLAGGRFDDEAHNAAMSQVGGLTETRNRAENAELSRGQFKMVPERLPQPPSVQRPNRPINQATLDEMRATPNSAPPLDPRPINPETLAEMRANNPLGNGPLSPIDPLSK